MQLHIDTADLKLGDAERIALFGLNLMSDQLRRDTIKRWAESEIRVVSGETRTTTGNSAQTQNLPKLPERPAETLAPTTAEEGEIDPSKVGFGNAAVPLAAAAGPADALLSTSASTEQPVISERDSSGLAWNEKIHSGTKAVNKDGTWRNRKGTDKLTISRVTAEMRAHDLATMPPVAATAVVPSVPVAAGQLTFGHIVKRVESALTSGKLTQEALQTIVASCGLMALPDLLKRPDLFEYFVEQLP
jgi:hypothetical protein